MAIKHVGKLGSLPLELIATIMHYTALSILCIRKLLSRITWGIIQRKYDMQEPESHKISLHERSIER